MPLSKIEQSSVNSNVAGTGPAFSAVPNAAQTGISSGIATKILFQTVTFDTTSGNFASSRWTPLVAGYYQINSSVQIVTGTGTTSANYISINKNGSEYRRGVRTYASTASNNWGLTISDVIYMNGTTDYLEIYAFSNGGTWATEGTLSYFSGSLVRAA